MIGRMKLAAVSLSAAGLVTLAMHEGFEPVAKPPIAGDVPTYGFGNTRRLDGTPVQNGDRINPVQALGLKRKELESFEAAVRKCVKVDLSQREFDIYVNHAYNIGTQAFCSSTIVKNLNAGHYMQACDSILMWRKFQGRDCSQSGSGCAGLWTRRQVDHGQCVAEVKRIDALALIGTPAEEAAPAAVEAEAKPGMMVKSALWVAGWVMVFVALLFAWARRGDWLPRLRKAVKQVAARWKARRA